MKWICCQLGAREHYAIPRALFLSGDCRLLPHRRLGSAFIPPGEDSPLAALQAGFIAS